MDPKDHLPAVTPAKHAFREEFVFLLMLLVGLAGWPGCTKSAVDQALDSDANGYLCMACKAKFYTDRRVFATHCPNCQKQDIEQVLGFVCGADKHVTVGPRGRGSNACEKCGALTTALSIPREAELKSWGAAKTTPAEAGGN